jgi:hypothetical protein
VEAFDYKCEGFIKITRLFGNFFQRNGGFNKKSEAFSKIRRLFKDTFDGIEAFLKCCEVFSKNSRLFKNISRYMEVFVINMGHLKYIFRPFKYIFEGWRLLLRLRGF